MLTTLMHDHFMPGDGFFNSIWPILLMACVGVFVGMRLLFISNGISSARMLYYFDFLLTDIILEVLNARELTIFLEKWL